MVLGIIVTGVLMFYHGVSLIPPKYMDRVEDSLKPVNIIEYFVSIGFGLFFVSFGILFTLYLIGMINGIETGMVLLDVVSMPLCEFMGIEISTWIFLIFIPSLALLLYMNKNSQSESKEETDNE